MDKDIAKIKSSDKESFDKLKELAKATGAKFEYEVDKELWFINITIKALSDIHIWMNRDKPNGRLYCTSMSFEGIWRDEESDTEDRYLLVDQEMIDTVKALLNKEIAFHSSPTWFNKARGYIIIEVNREDERFMQRANVFELPVLSPSQNK